MEEYYKGGIIFMAIALAADVPLSTPLDAVVIPGDGNLIGCLTQSGFNIARDTIDVSSQCSDDTKEFIKGLKNVTYTGTINSIMNANPKYSMNALADLANSGETFWVYLYDEDLTVVRFGKALLSSYAEDNPYNDKATANFTMQGTGDMSTVYPATT